MFWRLFPNCIDKDWMMAYDLFSCFLDHQKCLNCEFFFSDLIYVYYYGMLTIVVSFVSIPLVVVLIVPLISAGADVFLVLMYTMNLLFSIRPSKIQLTLISCLKNCPRTIIILYPWNYHGAFLRPKEKILKNSICS